MKFLKWLILIPLAYWTEKFCVYQTDGFTLLKMQSTLAFNPKWEVTEPLPQKITSLLCQKFTYLNSGGQCYAFASEDGTIVIKFFKHHLRRLPWLLAHLPLPPKYAALREKQRVKRLCKLDRDFTSYKIAYEMLREESGLLYLHLNKTKNANLSTTIVDKLGISHKLDLNTIEFIIQYKADLALTHLKKLIQGEQIDQGKEAINSILSLIISRCQKGIYDEDPRLHCNLGFKEEKAMLIDIGRLRVDPKRIEQKVYREDIKHITYKLNQWLLKESPELANYLEERLNAL